MSAERETRTGTPPACCAVPLSSAGNARKHTAGIANLAAGNGRGLPSSLSGKLPAANRCGTCLLSDRSSAVSAGLWLAGGVQHVPGVGQLQDGYPQRPVGLRARGGPPAGLFCTRRSPGHLPSRHA